METVSDYKKGLAQHLMEICRSKALLGGELLQTSDLDDKWQSLAPEFLAVLATIETLYTIAASICLHDLGYKWSQA